MNRSQLTAHYSELSKQLSNAQKHGEFCDLELVCNGHAIPVHKVIVCPQCPVIKAACTGSFKESSGRYEIKDCSLDTVQAMVDYLYRGNYKVWNEELPEESHEKSSGEIFGSSWWTRSGESPPESTPKKRDVLSELNQHIRMFNLADKYLIDGLVTLSEKRFKSSVRDVRNTETFTQFVAEVYDLQCELAKQLRDIVVESIRERIAVIPLKPNVQKALDGVIDEVPEFAADLAKSFIQQPINGPLHYLWNSQAGFDHSIAVQMRGVWKRGSNTFGNLV